jgi:taurine dioxygenase
LWGPNQNFLKSHFIVSKSNLHKNNERLAHLSNPSQEVFLEAVHPAIMINSDTGLPSIYVNQEHSSHFQGMTVSESQPIIDYLVKHIAQDKYRVEVNWLPGTVLISDNRSTQHRAIDNYYGHSRILRRVIVKSEI